MPSKWSMRIYTQPEQLADKIDEYFVLCEKQTKENIDSGYKRVVAPNLAGMAQHLGICKKTFHKYKTQPEYKNLHDVIHMAYDYLENWYVNAGVNGCSFSQFYLGKVFSADYGDKQEVNYISKTMMPTVKLGDKSLTFDCGEEIQGAEPDDNA